jgi:hypothetical protein
MQLWKSLGDSAANKTARTLILQQIGDPRAQRRYSETGGDGCLVCFKVEFVSYEGIEHAQFDGLAIASDTI